MKKTRAAGGGRKPLTAAEPTVKVAITLLASQAEAMKQLGNGNLSAGIRKAIEMKFQQTSVIRVEPVTYTDPYDKVVTRNYEVRQCITCGKEFYTPVGSTNEEARSLYCGEHYAEYQKDFQRRLSSVDWDNQANEMADGNPPQ